MTEFEAFKRKRDLALGSIDSFALLSYVVDACSSGAGISTAEFCGVAKDLGLMAERPVNQADILNGDSLPGDVMLGFSERLMIDLATGRKRIVERYRGDKH